MNLNASNMSSTHETQAKLAKRLKEVLEQRGNMEANVKSNQNDLEKMVGKKTKRPRETIAEIDEEIAKLELERTINSMSLADERAILKQIHKLNVTRREVSELVAHNHQVQAKKTVVSTLRVNLKEQREEITELKQELAAVNTAVTLGCEVKDLVCTKVDCPADKMGAVIGKKGKNVQELRSTTKVDVDIVRNNNSIHLTGTSESLDKAITNLDKVISQTEEIVELSRSMHTYLTSARIGTLAEWRERYAAVHVGVSRSNGDDASPNTQMRIRGIAADIAALKKEVLNLKIMEQTLHLTSRDAGLLVGKAGATIASLVEKHQSAIDVQRPTKAKDGGDEADNAVAIQVTVTGPLENVERAVAEIENMVAANKDHDGIVALTPTVKSVLLLNSGAGLQELRRNVNEALKSADENVGGSVMVSLLDTNLALKGKAKALEIALDVVNKEISRIETMVIKIKVDPFVIPVIIGKGGQGIKDLKAGTKSVFLDVDRESSQVAVCGLDQAELTTVVAAVEAFLAVTCVKRLRLESDDTGSTNSFSMIARSLLRSAAFKDAKELVFILLEESAKELVLRGKPDDVEKAVAMVNEFLSNNYVEELVVSIEDLSAMLTGGKASKIVEVAAQAGVNLSTDRERNVIIAKGEKCKVIEGMKSIREFLYGSADVTVSKLEAASSDVLGVVIGKGGKTLADLQRNFAVSILVNRADTVLTLRGEREKVASCRIEVMKLILSASVTKTVDLSEAQLLNIEKSKIDRKISQALPSQVTISKEKCNISFRGSPSDVQMAVSLLNEHLNGIYESRMQLGSMSYKKIEDACRNPAHLDRIEKQSTAKISLDNQSKEIVLSGSRDNVKIAKVALMTLLDFVLGANFSRCDLPDIAIPMIAKPTVLAEIAATTDTLLTVDRDLNSIIIVASDSDKAAEAGRMIEAKLAEIEALVFVWKFATGEDWLVSVIIGKNGETVKKLRQQTGCTIEVNSSERRVILFAADSTVVADGKSMLDTFVEKSRNERCIIPMPETDMPAFVGRGGANIKKFSQEHGVEVQIFKKPDNVIHIVGKVDSVTSAKLSIEEWIVRRAESLKDAQGEESKVLNAKLIPVVIGTKGATIRSLEREFGCKVDIERSSYTVTVKGGTATKRAALLEKMNKIISEDAEKPKDEQSEADSTKENHVAQQTAVVEEKKVNASELEPRTVGAEMAQNDFPSLTSNRAVSEEAKPLSETVWSAKTNEVATTPFIGDVDEANYDASASTLLEQMD